MKKLEFCEEWGEKLAARHPEDLTPIDQEQLHKHMSECSKCYTAYNVFKALEGRIENLPQVGPLPSLRLKLQSIKQDPPALAFDGAFLRIQAHSYSKSFEVSPEEVENAELMVEDAVSLVLLDLFGEAEVDKVAVLFSPLLPTGQRDCSIQIQAQCSLQSFTLFPRTKENIELSVGKIVCAILKELFGPVTMDETALIGMKEGKEDLRPRYAQNEI